MDNNGPSVNVDDSQIVVLSSDDENYSRNSHDSASNEKGSSSVISVDDDDNDESAESDCEILSVEDLQRGGKWRDNNGPFKRLNNLIQAGFNDPRLLLVQVFGMDEDSLPSDPNHLLNLLIILLAEPVPRRRLRHINGLENVLSLLSTCTSILKNPIPFFKFAKELFPGQFTPSITHRLIALLESKRKLLRNYTQNIDTLEQAAGVTRLIQCHGSFASATCTTCKLKVSSDFIKEAVFAQSIPRCTNCWPPNLTPSLPSDEVNDLESTNHSSDLSTVDENSNSNHASLPDAIPKVKCTRNVIGSSLKVRPVAHIPNVVRRQVPQILINREPLASHNFDVELLGDCDIIVSELCHRLGWEISGISNYTPLTEISLESMKQHVTESSNPTSESPVASHSIGENTILPEPSKKEFRTNDTVVEVSEDEYEDSVWEVGSNLPPGTFTRIYPNQYVFAGAEIYVKGKPGEIIISCSSSDISTASHPSSSLLSSDEDDELDKLSESHKTDECISVDVNEKEESNVHPLESRKSLKRRNSSDHNLSRNESPKQPRSM
ncbi:unnamed protein product [Heterobilharzia americana]|nr:unnamed protein product [Heterobilharzia americana]